MSWITVNEFKEMNDVEIDDNVLQNFINRAEDMFKMKFFMKKQFVYNNKKLEFEFLVDWYLADNNKDWVVDRNDVRIYKTDGEIETPLIINTFKRFLYTPKFQSTLTTESYYPSTKIKMKVDDYTFTDDEKVVFEFYVSPINFTDERHQQFVKQYINLLTQQLILKKFMVGSVEDGITSWSLNGVSVSTSPDIIQTQIEKLNERMRELVEDYGIMLYATF